MGIRNHQSTLCPCNIIIINLWTNILNFLFSQWELLLIYNHWCKEERELKMAGTHRSDEGSNGRYEEKDQRHQHTRPTEPPENPEEGRSLFAFALQLCVPQSLQPEPWNTQTHISIPVAMHKGNDNHKNTSHWLVFYLSNRTKQVRNKNSPAVGALNELWLHFEQQMLSRNSFTEIRMKI